MEFTANRPWSWSSGANLMFGSYAINGWLYPFKGGTQLYFPSDGVKCFGSDNASTYPSQTPFFMNAVWSDIWPKATDRPTPDRYNGGTVVDQEMQRCLIARHGATQPAKSLQRVDIKHRLPGSINLSCADGHSETAPLESLWNYRWHVGYVVPNIRPGLCALITPGWEGCQSGGSGKMSTKVNKGAGSKATVERHMSPIGDMVGKQTRGGAEGGGRSR